MEMEAKFGSISKAASQLRLAFPKLIVSALQIHLGTSTPTGMVAHTKVILFTTALHTQHLQQLIPQVGHALVPFL
jgi:hypothetical protein